MFLQLEFTENNDEESINVQALEAHVARLLGREH